MSTVVASRAAALFPTAHVRGRFITRREETPLGWGLLTAGAAEQLVNDELGWFVGGHPGVVRAAEQFGRLDTTPGGVWVVVPLGRDLSHELYTHWPHGDQIANRLKPGGSVWRGRKVWVAMPEDLEELISDARAARPGVAGIIIFDPPCAVHRSRGGTDSWGHVHHNDRPQHIVNFRAALATTEWVPPLLLLTERPAKSVDTESAARAFCLNGFRFVAGDTFACWEEPIDPT